eukprot:4242357-Prymnesium_polylepis.1
MACAHPLQSYVAVMHVAALRCPCAIRSALVPEANTLPRAGSTRACRAQNPAARRSQTARQRHVPPGSQPSGCGCAR